MVLSWREKNPQIRYILSEDVKTDGEALRMGPDDTLELPDLKVRTLPSTDEGVAFLVETDGQVIYHAGDLNWWHWNGESETYNREMGEAYRSQIDRLAGKRIDLAFVPMDPRLEDKYLWGIDYFMKTAVPRWLAPIHFRDRPKSLTGWPRLRKPTPTGKSSSSPWNGAGHVILPR